MGNASSVVLLTAAEDTPPAINASLYADVKVKVGIVNVNERRGRNGNDQCGVGGGGGGSKEGKDDKNGGG